MALAGGAVALGLSLGDAGSTNVDTTVSHCVRAPRRTTPAVAARSIAAPPPVPAGAAAPTTAAPSVFIRVNQVGFAGGCAKLALVMSQRALDGAAFQITDPNGRRVFAQGALGSSRGAWSSHWGYVYPLDFGDLRTPGRYVIEVAGVRSPAFSVGSTEHLYAPLAVNAVRFFQAQRDGPDVILGALRRQPSHLRDAHAAVYRQPLYSDRTLLGSLTPAGGAINASGGWFDAGDYLKFVETASFSDTLMLWTLRDYRRGVADRQALRREARYGLDWLLRMWDPGRRVLYYQVGVGDGNGTSVLGDHDLWRLPQVDDSSRARPGAPDYFVANRPVFPANGPGGQISPNLAGRVAASFGLCAQVFAERDRAFAGRCLRAGAAIYALANTNPGQLLSTSPHAYYGDGIWQDDMELGAVELYLGTRALGEEDSRLPPGFKAIGYLNPASRWADAYSASAANGQDTLNIYDVAPLAHYDLVRALRSQVGVRAVTLPYPSVNISTDPNSLVQDLHDQLALAARVGQPDPFRLANVAGNTDTVPHALGVAIQSRLYDLLTHSATFEGLAETQLDWVLGANAWGTSFVVGAGSLFPQCLADPLANLGGSLDGNPPLLVGATVDGPNDPVSLRDRGAPDGYRKCPANGGDRFAPFNAPKVAYVDDVTSATTSEPADDFVALSLVAFAQAGQTQP